MSAGAGGVDWLARWREMRAAASDQAVPGGEARPSFARARGDGNVPPCVDPWASRAARFDRMGRERGPADPTIGALAALIRPDDTVVDVGAGAGRHVVALAGRCRRVIAIEPSPAMRGRLEARLGEEGLTNVEVVGETWPIARPIEADVVYSCHVLYGVDEVEGFLGAMTRAAGRTAALVLGPRAPADQLAPLWAALHGRDRPPRPAALEALLVLYQMGLQPCCAPIEGSRRPMVFSESDEDLAELCHRMDLAPTEEEKVRMKRVLAALAPAADGRHGIGASGPNLLVTWQRRD